MTMSLYLLDSVIVDKAQYLIYTKDPQLASITRTKSLQDGLKELE